MDKSDFMRTLKASMSAAAAVGGFRYSLMIAMNCWKEIFLKNKTSA